MIKSSPKEALPPMRAGERENRAGGEQYCLSPLPLPTDSEHGVDVAHIDVRHNDTTMDLRQGANHESLLTAGHTLSVGLTFMAAFGAVLLLMAIAKGSLPLQLVTFLGGGFYMLFLFVFILAIVMGGVILKRTPPIRLHRQRREVAFVVESPG